MSDLGPIEGYLTITEAMEKLGVSNRQVILNHIKRKDLAVKRGWNWFIPVENLETLREAITTKE